MLEVEQVLRRQILIVFLPRQSLGVPDGLQRFLRIFFCTHRVPSFQKPAPRMAAGRNVYGWPWDTGCLREEGCPTFRFGFIIPMLLALSSGEC